MHDYVIVGGGAAGCALAARLSEDAGNRVLLLEAGPADTDPYIHMPVGFFKMTGGPLTWGYRTAAAAETGKTYWTIVVDWASARFALEQAS